MGAELGTGRSDRKDCTYVRAPAPDRMAGHFQATTVFLARRVNVRKEPDADVW